MPAALRVDWNAIEKAAIAGVSYPQLAKTYDIPVTAIRKRSSRFSWPVPTAIALAVTNAEIKAQNAKILAVTVKGVNELHEESAVTLVTASHKALKKFSRHAPVPDNWTDAKTAYSVMRLAAGIDKEGGPVVSLNLWGGGAIAPVAAPESFRDVSPAQASDPTPDPIRECEE